MAGYIGSKASVVSSGAERKKTFAITTSTTSLTGLVYTPTKVHVFHNGVRLVDGTDFTATNSTSITLTVAAESGDQVVVVSYASFQVADAYTQTEADAEFVAKAGDTMTGDLSFGDNDKAIFGAGSDLQIYHDGSHSRIDEQGTGVLFLQTNGTNIQLNKGTSENMLVANVDGSVDLYYDNSAKLATTSTGIDVTGTVTAAGLNVDTDGSASAVSIGLNDGNSGFFKPASNAIGFSTSATERMRIDASGNVLANTTSSTTVGNGGFAIKPQTGNGTRVDISNAGQAMLLDGATSGPIIGLYGNGNAVGSIGNFSTTVVYLAGISNGLKIVAPAAGVDAFGPSTTNGGNRDNTMDIGWSSNRFDDIFATNGTIQTSDRNEKQDVAALTATEMLVAARISGLFKTFRWIDSVADKGDNARTHTGVIAQDVQAAFIAEGLDSGDYALFTSATWWETQTDVPAVEADEDNEIEAADAYTRTDTFDTLDEAPDGATERTRMGIRYPELLAFVGAYNEQRFASIETRLAALEGN